MRLLVKGMFYYDDQDGQAISPATLSVHYKATSYQSNLPFNILSLLPYPLPKFRILQPTYLITRLSGKREKKEKRVP